MTVADTILYWLSIALSVGAIALSIDAMRLTREAKKLRADRYVTDCTADERNHP